MYRAIPIGKTDFVYGFHLEWFGKSWIYPEDRGVSFPIGPELIEVQPETVSQFTGKYSKNDEGKEIFGGDFIEGRHGYNINREKYGGKMEVYWHTEFARWKCKQTDGTWDVELSWFGYIEIIGNIHQEASNG